jgi:O-antigen ligase
MKSKGKLGLKEKTPLINQILLFCSAITLILNPEIQDPFNSPKFWLLILMAAFLLGHIFVSRKILFSNISSKILALILTIFLVFNLISSLKTNDLFTAFMGDSLRRNGFITYISLSIVMLTTAIYFRITSIKRLSLYALITGTLLTIYGLMQISGVDFIEWNNPYNAIISTVGNPNFAAAIMAIMAIIIFAPALNSDFSKAIRASSLILTCIIIYTIYLSNARQGLLTFLIGSGIYIIVWSFIKSKKLGYIFATGGIITSIFSVLGMLQIGPLTNLLYKGSVTVRGYYWDAGIKMVQSNPIFGVGSDSYGNYFKEFRDMSYPLKYGFGITSSNAHNLPIQIFATLGIFAGITYLLLLLYIFQLGIKLIKSKQGNDRLLVTSIFSAWLAYHAQSIISIDNIGISIWGWMLGGAIVGLSIDDKKITQEINSLNLKNNSKNLGLLRPAISLMSMLISLVIIIPHYQGESNMFQSRLRFNPGNPQNQVPLREYAFKTINGKLTDPSYKYTAAGMLFSVGYTEESLIELNKLNVSDPRNLDILTMMAEINENLSRHTEAIKLRSQIAKYDKWNASNYLQLGRDYKIIQDFTNMELMKSKILDFAEGTPEANKALAELVR